MIIVLFFTVIRKLNKFNITIAWNKRSNEFDIEREVLKTTAQMYNDTLALSAIVSFETPLFYYDFATRSFYTGHRLKNKNVTSLYLIKIAKPR